MLVCKNSPSANIYFFCLQEFICDGVLLIHSKIWPEEVNFALFFPVLSCRLWVMLDFFFGGFVMIVVDSDFGWCWFVRIPHLLIYLFILVDVGLQEFICDGCVKPTRKYDKLRKRITLVYSGHCRLDACQVYAQKTKITINHWKHKSITISICFKCWKCCYSLICYQCQWWWSF